jgi:hypothetical protein
VPAAPAASGSGSDGDEASGNGNDNDNDEAPAPPPAAEYPGLPSLKKLHKTKHELQRTVKWG